jgi:hypothetical protein
VPTYILVAIFSGVAFSLIGIAFRLGQSRGILPIQIVCVSATIGAVFFAVKGWNLPWSEAPQRLLLAGAIAGVTQYAILGLISLALKMGPLSPLWCSVLMAFVPVIIYTHVGYGETLSTLQYVSLATAVACVFAASFEVRKDVPLRHLAGTGFARQVAYGFVLLAAMLVNSVSNVAISDMGHRFFPDGVSYSQRFADVYLLVMYASMAVCVPLELAARRRFNAPLRPTLLLGLLSATGSIAGLWAVAFCADKPAGVVFPLSGVAGVLAASLISVLLFAEKAAWAWYATVGLGIVTILLQSLGSKG